MGLIDSINLFLDAGGIVLWLILGESIILWTLVGERLVFLFFFYPELKQNLLDSWNQRQDKRSPNALTIRECIISEAKISLNKNLPTIQVLIGLCPLLGLLGTVTGMIHVFDVMAVTGTGNARAMASGVSQATIPTMAGMVIAIAGLYFNRLIVMRISDESHHLADLLTYN